MQTSQTMEIDDEEQKEESTVMEGFRYRINNTVFPVYKGKE